MPRHIISYAYNKYMPMPIVAYGYDSNFNPIVTPIFLLAEFLSCSAYECKGGFVPDQPCQCNLACQEFGDCCPDFFPVCLPGKNCYHVHMLYKFVTSYIIPL